MFGMTQRKNKLGGVLVGQIAYSPIVESPWPHMAIQLERIPDELSIAELAKHHPANKRNQWVSVPSRKQLPECWEKWREVIDSEQLRNALLTRFAGYIQPQLSNPVSHYTDLPHRDRYDEKHQRIDAIPGEPFTFTRLDVRQDETGYQIKPHLDRPRRLFSILLYLGGWSEIEGGVLKLHGEQPKYIAPQPGLMIIYPRVRESMHSVSPVTRIVGDRRFLYVGITASSYPWTYEDIPRQ